MLYHRHLGAGVSLALHLAVILTFLWPGTAAPSKPRNAQRSVDVRLLREGGRLRPQVDAAADDPAMTTSDGPGTKVPWSKCDGRLYSGIGLSHWLNGEIVEVAPGGPADKAGLRAGDTLLDPDAMQADEHPPGTRIALRFLRDEHEMPTVVAVVEKICDEQPRPSSRRRNDSA